MISKLKLAAYVALIALAIVFGRAFYSSYTRIAPATDGSATNAADGPGTNAAGDSDAGSNAGTTNPAAPAPTATNVTLQAASNAAAPASGTGGSNLEGGAELAASTAAPGDSGGHGGKSVRDLVLFVGALLSLGLLVAYDLTQYLGSRAGDYLFNDVGEGERDPEYELAEQEWVNGKPLEAIEMLREFLKKNPRAQYAALRIAEIYEKDLRNEVAASLEYEEILKKRLPAERWGWAAIHLCNLYSRMGHGEKMRALLERIARDYPQTGAAKKARQNLGLPEPEGEEAAAAPAQEAAAEADPNEEHVFDLDEANATAEEEAPPAAPEAEPEPPSPEPPPKSNLPPGFRKK